MNTFFLCECVFALGFTHTPAYQAHQHPLQTERRFFFLLSSSLFPLGLPFQHTLEYAKNVCLCLRLCPCLPYSSLFLFLHGLRVLCALALSEGLIQPNAFYLFLRARVDMCAPLSRLHSSLLFACPLARDIVLFTSLFISVPPCVCVNV